MDGAGGTRSRSPASRAWVRRLLGLCCGQQPKGPSWVLGACVVVVVVVGLGREESRSDCQMIVCCPGAAGPSPPEPL